MANSIMYTFYALESKKTYEYHYYYFAGLDDAGNVLTTDDPSKAVGFHHNKDAKEFLKKHPDLAERFNVQSMITNETPCYYVEFKPITEAKNLSIVMKVV